MKSTMVELIPELYKLSPCYERDVIIAEAEAGEFHDFKNKKYVCGKMQLAAFMNDWIKRYPQDAAQAKSIRDDVIEGEYDETADEEDKENLRSMINNDNTMSAGQKQALKEAIGLAKPQKTPWGKNFFRR